FDVPRGGGRSRRAARRGLSSSSSLSRSRGTACTVLPAPARAALHRDETRRSASIQRPRRFKENPAATYSPRGATPKYHRRWRSSLPCSEWERVFPRRYCHRKSGAPRRLRRGGNVKCPLRALERARAIAREQGEKIPSPRPISTGRLNTLPCVHLRPINLVVYQGPYPVIPVGDLVSRKASRLDAFSAYPFRRSPTSRALGRTTGTRELRPSRSSRTRDSSSQVSYAHGG